MKWISMKKRPPEQKIDFLGTDGKVVFAAYWDDNSETYKVGGWECCYYCGGASTIDLLDHSDYTKCVTHWMPLPDLPIEEKIKK